MSISAGRGIDARVAALDNEFKEAGLAKAQELVAVYRTLPVKPDQEGDKSLQQRQTMMRGILAHYASLRRLLQQQERRADEPFEEIDEAGLRAILHGDDDG